MKKILLFSPTGYIGQFIKERIQAENGIRLYEITRNSDLTQYRDEYDVMIYSAATSQAAADKLVKDNVAAAVSIVNFCKERHVQRIIYLSSDSIYGELNADVATEKTIMVNPDIYGVTKYLTEKIIMESKIPYYILRLPCVVGRIWRRNFISDLIVSMKRNENVKLYNINRKFNNILDVDDLNRFIIMLCDSGMKGKNEIFLLGNTKKTQLREVVYYIKDLYHSTSQISSVDTDQKRYFTLDVSKAEEYGYSSKDIKTIINELYRILEEGN